ncbi:MAG: phosphotyrosine protein phosphatase [Betaproteobacteria bacterium]|nr:phosphotyrosine protein phosphatase [Betaproteobacteria bacterium]
MIARLARGLRARHGTHRGWVRLQLTRAAHGLGLLRPYTRLRLARVDRVVFVCLGNINRSAFALAVARQAGLRAESVGLATTHGAPASPAACAAALRRGLSLRAHQATPIADLIPRPGDLYAVMEWRHADALLARGLSAQSVLLLGAWARPKRLHLHDPHTLDDAFFDTCFGLIDSAVRALAAELAAGGHPAAAAVSPTVARRAPAPA